MSVPHSETETLIRSGNQGEGLPGALFVPPQHLSAVFALLAVQVVSFVHRKGRKETPG